MALAAAPAALPDGELPVGEGLRVFKTGFIEVNVYRLTFYVDMSAASEVLSSPAGAPSVAFYTELMQARVRKVFHLTFCRSVSGTRLQDNFRKNLEARAGPSAAAQVQQLLAAIPDVSEGDVLLFAFAADGRGVELSARGASVLRLECQELWNGVQRIYFDEDTEFPAIRKGAVARLPSLLTAARQQRTAVIAARGSTAAVAEVAEEDSRDAVPAAEAGRMRSESEPQVGQFQSFHSVPSEDEAEIVGPTESANDLSASADVAATPSQTVPTASGYPAATASPTGPPSGYPMTAASVPTGGCAFDLRLEIETVLDLRSPEYRTGDLTRQLLHGKEALLSKVYVEVQVGSMTHRSSTRSARPQQAYQDHEGATLYEAKFENEFMLFSYGRESEMSVRVLDRRGVQAMLRGDPVIGQGRLLFEEAFREGASLRPYSELVPLTLARESAGILALSFRLLRRPERPPVAT